MNYDALCSVNCRDENTSEWDYNCMSYVFNASEWLKPIDCEFINVQDILDWAKPNGVISNKTYEEIENCLNHFHYDHPLVAKACVASMLEIFPQLRRIKSFDELKSNEYGICFATAPDGDFHFGKFEDGIWSHKMGSCPIEIVSSEDEIFSDRYINYRYHFALPKGDIKVNC